jgi:hypothetical protein
MAKPDEDDLLHVDEQQWVRHDPSIGIRAIGLVAALAGIAGAMYLAMYFL